MVELAGEGAVQADYGTLLKYSDMVKEAIEIIQHIVTGELPKVAITTRKLPEICALFGLRLMDQEKFGLDPLLRLEADQRRELPELAGKLLLSC